MSKPDFSDPRQAWLRLANVPWLGATILAGLVREFKTPEAIFTVGKAELQRVQGWSYQRLERFLRERHTITPVCAIDILERKKVRVITFNDADYPRLLREIADAPPLLFAQGNGPAPTERPVLAIVGARQGTQIGYDIAMDFARALADAGFTIVSGLALGIDTYAHRGALEAGGHTVAVLGCGPDVIYPVGNRRIREAVEHSGLVLSEFAPGTPARPWHFPVRNRLISGMSVGTLVVEASARSGSLITARLAAEQDRDVFAVPGTIYSKVAQGTLELIKDGAHLVTSPEEIVQFYQHLLPNNAKTTKTAKMSKQHGADEPGLTDAESRLVAALAREPMHFDTLLQTGAWDRNQLFSLLMNLEIRNVLVKLPGNLYHTKVKSPCGRAT